MSVKWWILLFSLCAAGSLCDAGRESLPAWHGRTLAEGQRIRGSNCDGCRRAPADRPARRDSRDRALRAPAARPRLDGGPVIQDSVTEAISTPAALSCHSSIVVRAPGIEPRAAAPERAPPLG